MEPCRSPASQRLRTSWATACRGGYTFPPRALHVGARGTASRSRRHALETPALISEALEIAPSLPESLEAAGADALDYAGLDRLEEAMLQGAPVVNLPLVHRFTHGLYIREIFMPAGTLLTSKIHKTQHPFVILKGKVSVLIPGEDVAHLEAPHFGITQPGTRRLLYIHEDTTWLTFHPNPEDVEDLEQIEERLIERRAGADGRTMFEHYTELLKAAGVPMALHEGGAA